MICFIGVNEAVIMRSATSPVMKDAINRCKGTELLVSSHECRAFQGGTSTIQDAELMQNFGDF